MKVYVYMYNELSDNIKHCENSNFEGEIEQLLFSIITLFN